MQGNPQIIRELNKLLKNELTGDQPVLPARPHAEALGLRAAGQEDLRRSRSAR